MDETNVDVIVIGGGVAGLSGALTLARSRRSVLVIDAGEPRNAPASGVHGFLSRDGVNPLELLKIGAAEVESYGGTIVRGRVTSVRPGFVVETEHGQRFGARRLLVATGLVDELPEIEGLRERWGRDVLHCPYCHGWEVRDQPIGVLGSVHQAMLFRQLSDDVVLFQPDGDVARGIRVVEGEVTGLEITDDQLTGVKLASGQVIPRRVLVVRPRFVAAGIAGLAATEHPFGMRIEADQNGRTSMPGVWVAGNVTDLAAGVAVAAAQGASAAAQINADLVFSG